MFMEKDTNKEDGNTTGKLHLGQKQATGGRAVPGVIALAQRHAHTTVLTLETDIIRCLNLQWSNIKCLGSAGRRKNPDDTSGDIDLAIQLDAIGKSKDEALDTLEGYAIKQNLVYHRMNGLGIVSVAWPISGQSGKFVQADLMVVEDLKWVKWAMYSPDYRKDESQYKSGHRNWLIAAICNETKRVTNYWNGKESEWTALVFIWHDCAKLVNKTMIGVNGDFLMHPKKMSEKIYTRDPAEFVKFLFGKDYSPNDLLTYEDVREALDQPKFNNNRRRILQNFVKFVEKASLPVPEDAI